MIVVIGLLALIAAVILAMASVAANSGSTQPVNDNFVIFTPWRGPRLCACAATGSPVNPPTPGRTTAKGIITRGNVGATVPAVPI